MRQGTQKILIADDHHAVRQGIRAFLEGHEGWQIVGEAADGHEALQLVRRWQPDIVVLDYSLPLINGLELTRTIKRELPDTEILLYTMHDQESTLAQVLRAGARGFVLKSDPASHLIAAVEALAMRKSYFSPEISEALLEYFIDQTDGGKGVVLTPRERQIVQLIAEGKINKQIAHLLNISIKTVETHRSSVMHKLKLKTTAELVLYALRNNIVQA